MVSVVPFIAGKPIRIRLKSKRPKFREIGITEIIFDPQLYCPKIDRGEMANHSYFPNDMDTADPSSETWWRAIVKNLVVEAKNLDVNAVCSPAILPKKYNAEYYGHVADIFSMLVDELDGDAIRPIMTVCVSLKELAKPDDAFEIASIVSRHNPKSIYLVLESEIEPRREISDDNLVPLMAFIATLEKSGCEIIVSHCSSDMVLMKACGASHCATGNFFNLRRFTRSRFDDQEEEGGRPMEFD
ncbi:MAG: hypothetical protein WDN00_00390 [Limisphaerales bacterium]